MQGDEGQQGAEGDEGEKGGNGEKGGAGDDGNTGVPYKGQSRHSSRMLLVNKLICLN